MVAAAKVDGTGLIRVEHPVMETYTGKLVAFQDPKPEQIDILDIAHQLGMLCRYTGACIKRYSVAEHCCRVHDAYLNQAGYGGGFYDVTAEVPDDVAETALGLLMHDAHEAYTNDLSRPFLALLGVAEAVLPAQERLQTAIHEKFEMFVPDPAVLKALDNGVLKAEAEDNMLSCGAAWDLDAVEAADVPLEYWSPERAKAEFLCRFAMWRPLSKTAVAELVWQLRQDSDIAEAL